MRILLISTLLVGGFVFITAKSEWSQRHLIRPISAGARLWAGPAAVKSAGLGSDELNNIEIYKMAHLATVNITTTAYQRNFFLEVVPSRAFGSGLIISEEGRILTNNHVIQDSNKIEVTLSDQTRYKANLLFSDRFNDLALLEIKPKKKLPILRLGDSDQIQVGQKVLAIGNPFGFLEGTLTVGIVSSLGRSIRSENDLELEGLIQTDAAINPGNSGGPLLDSQGNVLGINTAILGQNGNIGIGFAMPINRAKAMLEDFQTGRKPPTLGVKVVYIAGDYADALELPTQGGLLVQTVDRGSPADRAGIHAGREEVQIGNARLLVGGDLIVSIDGKAVDRSDAIARSLAHKRSGDNIELTVFRGGRTVNVRVKLSASGEVL
jgi:S1-C subfamily serine protease